MEKIQIPILRGVVCGMEHAGTTLLSQLLRQHPMIETGYEVGALMYDTPADLWTDTGKWKQYRNTNNKYGLEQGWQLDEAGRQAVRNAQRWQSFYWMLHAHSPLVRKKKSYLIDKTPPYQEHLTKIASRFDVPIVVIVKDPVLLYDSWYRRMKTPVGHFAQYYAGRAQATIQAQAQFPDQIKVIAYETLIRDSGVVMDEVFTHFGFEAMLLPDVMDVDFPEKVPDTVIDDIAMRLERVGVRPATRLSKLLPAYRYLRIDGEILREKFWW